MWIIESFLLFFCGTFIGFLLLFVGNTKNRKIAGLWALSIAISLVVCVVQIALGINNKPAIFLSGLAGIFGNILGFFIQI